MRRGSFLGQIPILIEWNQGDFSQKSEIHHTLQLDSREYVYQHAAEFTISCILGYPNDLLRMKKYWANFEQSLLLIDLQPTATHILLVRSFSKFCNSIIKMSKWNIILKKIIFLVFKWIYFRDLLNPKVLLGLIFGSYLQSLQKVVLVRVYSFQVNQLYALFQMYKPQVFCNSNIFTF